MRIRLLVLLCISGNSFGQTSDEILKRADEIRSPSGAYRMEVAVETPEKPTFKYELNIGGKDSSVIKTLAPKRELGKNFLMQGEEMWAYVPNIRRSIRVTLNQKLTGQASNGDISRMRWYGDYDSKIVEQTAKAWHLALVARKKGLTYDKISVWINKKNFYPIHGEYQSLSGRPLKKIQFQEFGLIGGGIRPMIMRIENADNPSDYSILRTLSMKEMNLPKSMFSKAALR